MANPRIVAAADQLAAVLHDIAPALATYRRRLIELGIPAEEAMVLVVGLQEYLLRAAEDRDGFTRRAPE